MAPIRRLQSCEGGRHRPVRLGSIDLVPAPLDDPPFEVQVQVVEEDTWRVLSPAPVLTTSFEHPIRLMTRVIEDRPARHGELLCRGTRWRAVVYDLDQEPICREDWARAALSRLLASASVQGLHSVALPLLGATHGGLPWIRSLALIAEALQPAPASVAIRRVWVQVESSRLAQARRRLEDRAPG
jgi:hypothetical protein